MAGPLQGNYSIVVSGGNVNVGYRSRMTCYSGQLRDYSTASVRTTTARITGSEQLLKDIPSSALSELVMLLNNPSVLGNNWKAMAAEMSLSFQTVQSLDHYGAGGMMNGVLEIMFQRAITVRHLVDMLRKIQRPDIIEILITAGLQESDKHLMDLNDNANTEDLSSDNLSRVTIVTSNSSNPNDQKQSSDHTNTLWKHRNKERLRPNSIAESSRVTNSCRNIHEPLDNTIPPQELDKAPLGRALDFCTVPVNITTDGRNHEEVGAVERQDFKTSIVDRIIRFIMVTYSMLLDSFSSRSNQ